MSGKATTPGRGRKPKPNKQKQLSGSKHVNPDAVEFDSITNVEPPDWLGELAREMWQTVCPQLCSKQILSVTDLHNLEAFCAAYDRWRQAEAETARAGITIVDDNGRLQKNPAVTVINESMRQMATFGSMLGLDPAARGRLIGNSSPADSNPFNKF